MSTETSGMQVVTQTDWHESEKGCKSMTLACAGRTVRVTQRAPGRSFCRIFLVNGVQHWRSLHTTDQHEAEARARAFLQLVAQPAAVTAAHTTDPIYSSDSTHTTDTTNPTDTAGTGTAGTDTTDLINAAEVADETPAPAVPVTAGTASSAGSVAATPAEPGPLTLGGLWQQYQQLARFRKQKPKTQEDLRYRARILLAGLGADTLVRELDRDALEDYELRRLGGGIEYVTTLRSRTGRVLPPRVRTSPLTGPRSVEADMTLLRSMVLWAHSKEINGRRLLDRDVMAGYTIPSEESPRQPVASHQRYRATLQATLELAEAHRSDPYLHRLYLMLHVVLIVLDGTGRRLSAVLGLRREDLRLDAFNGYRNAEITFRQDLDKKKRRATLPLAAAAAQALHVWLERRYPEFSGGFVFPYRDASAPLTKDRLAQLLQEAEAKAGLEPLDGSLCHAYRRKFATERGHLRFDVVMELMGLTDAKVFKESYCKTITKNLRNALVQAEHIHDTELECVAERRPGAAMVAVVGAAESEHSESEY